MKIREKLVVMILMLAARVMTEDSDLKKEIQSLSSTIHYAKDE